MSLEGKENWRKAYYIVDDEDDDGFVWREEKYLFRPGLDSEIVAAIDAVDGWEVSLRGESNFCNNVLYELEEGTDFIKLTE